MSGICSAHRSYASSCKLCNAVEELIPLKILLTKEEIEELFWGELEQYKIVLDEYIRSSRWSTHHDIVIQRLSDGRYFRSSYSRGSTEMQEHGPFEQETPEFYEVERIERTIVEIYYE